MKRSGGRWSTPIALTLVAVAFFSAQTSALATAASHLFGRSAEAGSPGNGNGDPCAPGPDGAIWVTADAGGPTLQEALDCAGPTGAEVRVFPGTYSGRFNVPASVRLVGSGAARTVLDGEGLGRTVTLGAHSAVERFTITGGVAAEGGGVFNDSGIGSRAATVRDNVIRGNTAFGRGGGASGALILIGNVIELNYAGTDGGGAFLSGEAGAGANRFHDNEAGGEGGGLHTFFMDLVYADSDPVALRLWNNLFTANRAQDGGGIYVSNSFCGPPAFTHNTLTGNIAVVSGGGLYFKLANDCDVDPPVAGYEFHNNVIVENIGGGVATNTALFLPLVHSDVWGNLPEDYTGNSPALTGIQGNLSADPGFRDATADDYRLTPDSPCVDAGTGAYPAWVPAIDTAGFPRALDGTLDGVAVHDMGALEERGEVEHLRFEPDAVTLTWDERVLVVSYNLYRGDLAILRAGGDYTQDPATVDNAERWCQRTLAEQSDTETPLAGSGFVYLVSPVGAAEGSLGFDGSNIERPNAAPCF